MSFHRGGLTPSGPSHCHRCGREECPLYRANFSLAHTRLTAPLFWPRLTPVGIEHMAQSAFWHSFVCDVLEHGVVCFEPGADVLIDVDCTETSAVNYIHTEASLGATADQIAESLVWNFAFSL